jgi:hypothetical protein
VNSANEGDEDKDKRYNKTKKIPSLIFKENNINPSIDTKY